MLIFAVCWSEQVEHLYRCEGRDLELRWLDCPKLSVVTHLFHWSFDAKTPESISPKWKYEANISLPSPTLRVLKPYKNLDPRREFAIQLGENPGPEPCGWDSPVRWRRWWRGWRFNGSFLSPENWPWPLHVSRKYLPKKDGICLCFFLWVETHHVSIDGVSLRCSWAHPTEPLPYLASTLLAHVMRALHQ